jgi:hypothetical protein
MVKVKGRERNARERREGDERRKGIKERKNRMRDEGTQ